MRTLTYVTLAFVVLLSNAQTKKFGSCHHCSMPVKDQNFASTAIATDGQRFDFDAIECLVNFLKEEDEADFKELLIADYFNSGQLVDARSASFLKSREIASPMGAYISGYSSKKDAESVQKQKGGEIMNWEQLKERFKESRFGMIDHPDHHHHRPDAYAPIGVMGDHLHHKKGIMISLRMMNMPMSGNLSGSSSIDDMAIFQSYMVAPQSMTMEMYMLGFMYAPSDKITIMVMQNLEKRSMDMRTMMGMEFSTESQGLGDTKIAILSSLLNSQNSSLHLNTSITIPGDNITLRDDTPMAENVKLPYPMQIGTGSNDLGLGFTAKTGSGNFTFGLQPIRTIRLNENNQGYRFGNMTEVSGWTSFKMSNWISISARGQIRSIDKIKGTDNDLNPMMAPPANTANSGGRISRLLFGANLSPGGPFQNTKIGIEYGFPIDQRVNGIQMREKSMVIAGLRYTI